MTSQGVNSRASVVDDNVEPLANWMAGMPAAVDEPLVDAEHEVVVEVHGDRLDSTIRPVGPTAQMVEALGAVTPVSVWDVPADRALQVAVDWLQLALHSMTVPPLPAAKTVLAPWALMASSVAEVPEVWVAQVAPGPLQPPVQTATVPDAPTAQTWPPL